jgi:hypothetical protein
MMTYLSNKASLVASRRSFLAGSRLALGAGLAIGLGLTGLSAPAKAEEGDCGNHKDHGKADPSCQCFLTGTHIQTTTGPRKIEELQIGDSVLTASGETKLIKWIGKRQFERASDPGAAPVRISCFAIDGKAPHADLYLSPGHAVYIDGVLIPARNLVNGITIVADAKPELSSITYYHIELETHEAILAEGLAVESFFGADRQGFDNVDDYFRLYGSPAKSLEAFAPIMSYYGGRQELASHVRSMLAPIYDFRKPIDKIRDRISDHAELARAA